MAKKNDNRPRRTPGMTTDTPKAPAAAPPRNAENRAGLVVGLGASAGGLQALSRFLNAMPATSGAAFVVIHHADPDHESLMVDLLAKQTDMTVVFAQDKTPILPNHVYVIPPKWFLQVEKGHLRLTEPIAQHGVRLPINVFLRSLAADQEQNAVAIILSGTGSDGAQGSQSIKEHGGLVLVQDPDEAAHDGMPRSALATEAADHVLPVDDMPAIIAKYAKHPYSADGRAAKALGENARRVLEQIISTLNAATPINFAMYKTGTMLRRIQRRMALHHMEDSHEYLALLKDNPTEVMRLCSDLLISVTSFFRDPDTFDYLAQNVLPGLVAGRSAGPPIRVWVPACATGEEAYSLAMLLIEAISNSGKDIKLQVFASDVDENALAVARAGIYPETIAAAVNPDRLARFFFKHHHTYRVIPALRDAVVFTNQNILADAPFSKIDLVSCRNLLIYLNPYAQEQVIRMFHFALNEHGILFLGPSETANNHEIYFRPKSKKYRVYERLAALGQRPYELSLPRRMFAESHVPPPQSTEPQSSRRLADLSQKLLIERYAPAAVLINARMECLYFQGPTDRYLKVPTGEANQNLLAMARDGIGAQMGSAVRAAIHQNKNVTRISVVNRDGDNVTFRIDVHPMAIDDARLFLVAFSDQVQPDTSMMLDDVPKDSCAYRQLEAELETTRQDLQDTIRDFELSTEELKATHEEAMSMNEEFQSTNEELETSREELQSLNEELTTLNAQLQQKVDEEHALSDDLHNLLFSAGIATLFLDRDLKIKLFTPAMRQLFNLIATDVGRPFGDITGKVHDPALIKDAQRVMAGQSPVDVEVKSDSGAWYIRRVLPYKMQNGQTNGVVITFSEVTEIKQIQEAHEQAKWFSDNIIATIREPLLVLDKDFNIVLASRSFHQMFQTIPAQTDGQNLFQLQNAKWNQRQLRDLLERVLPDQTTVESYQITIETAAVGPRTMVLNARRLEGNRLESDLILLAIEDMTDLLTMQRDLEERQARLRAIVDAAPEAIVTVDEKGIIGSFSPAAELILGFPAEEVIGKNVSVLMPEPDRSKHDGYMTRYLTTGEKRVIDIGRETQAVRKDGQIIPVRLTVAEWWLEGARYFTGIIHDLTEDMKRREALSRAQKMEAVGQLTGGMAHDFNNLLTIIIGNLELLDMKLTDDGTRALLQEALDASNLGAELTKQLLAFSANQALIPNPVDLNELVRSMVPLILRTLGDKIKLETKLIDELCPTLADKGQVENAILNLALNARDAMPDGGVLSIATRCVNLDSDYTSTQIDLKPGAYLALYVTDTGQGMPPEVVDRAFEPFFTTKGPRAGSGLGLSMVYGFAKQSGGHVAIYSEVGYGTTISLYLPVIESAGQVEMERAHAELPKSHNETILVVDDDPQVRRLTGIRLQELGYQVVVAEDGPSAMTVLNGNPNIQLMLTDVVMPGGMSGFDLAERARQVYPNLKILLATGYAKGIGNGLMERAAQYNILRKPYNLYQLAWSLRRELD
ncbi:chemotaxis protein CheB [Yoonia sp.]|uniref:chemotaxis protein CheB n=1 Tax=Yoonia sp. TaxID=2212373 RepID=UPI001A0BEA91|nr:chemotaxis protein CheB [Yoonia sp.]MBE0412735.1 PAS domain S-box protein [Yoonia sp.]